MLLSLAMRFILPILLLAPCLLSAQSAAPVIVIEQTRKVDVAVSPMAGTEGPLATRVLEEDLKRSGACRVVEPSAAAFTLSGTLIPSGIAGKASPKTGGAPLVESSFSGDARRAAHQFADAFIEALTGTPGFASSRITFASASAGKNRKKEIYISDIDGANARQLTQDGALGYGPKFSPDGSKIAYSSDKSGYRDTYVIDLNTKKRNCVAQFPGQNTGAAFSPTAPLWPSVSPNSATPKSAQSLRPAANQPASPMPVAPTAPPPGHPMEQKSFTSRMNEEVPVSTSSLQPGAPRKN